MMEKLGLTGRLENAVKSILVSCFFILSFRVVCFGQSDQTETITLSTYYPSPTGVYKTVRFLPNNALVPNNNCPVEGEVSYNQTMHELYVCKGSPSQWKRFGSVKQVQSGHGISPDQCTSPYASNPSLCTNRWYQHITFNPAFNSTPQVIVAPEVVSDPDKTPCAQGRSDLLYVYLETLDKNGFTVRGMGSPVTNVDCGAGTEGYRTRVQLGWIAIGD